jgi:hypothetical protein
MISFVFDYKILKCVEYRADHQVFWQYFRKIMEYYRR